MKWSAYLYKLFISVYRIFPFKKTICLLLKVSGIPNDKFYKDTKFTGVFDVVLDDKIFKLNHHESSIENEIFWKGLGVTWERDTLWLWNKLSQGAKVIFDIGANTGVYSIISKTINPTSTVYAFEPSKNVYHKLMQNNTLNNYNIDCLQIAISNHSGTQYFYDINSNLPTSGSLSPDKFYETCDDDSGKLKYEVQTITLDVFLLKNSIKYIDLMKIDVEMFEPEVLEGFKLITEYKPIIFIELLTDEIAEKVQRLLPSNSYLFYELDFEKLIPIEKLTKGRPHHWNFLLLPRDKKHLVESFIQ
jgi:FkbM family methyltransferase